MKNLSKARTFYRTLLESHIIEVTNELCQYHSSVGLFPVSLLCANCHSFIFLLILWIHTIICHFLLYLYLCQQQQTTNDNTVSISHGAAEEGGFLYERFPRSGLLAGDLVEGEQKMVPLRDLRRQLYLDFLIELRLPVRVSVFVCALMCVCFVCLCISVCLFLCLFCLFVY